MINGLRTINLKGLDKGYSSKFCVGSQIQHNTPEEGQRMHWLKHCEYNNEDEPNIPNTLSDKNWYYLIHSWRDKEVHTFPKGINPKINIIVWLDYQLIFFK